MQKVVKEREGVVEDVISLDKPRCFYLYTMYDRIAQDAAPVFCAVNDGVARRQVVRMLADSDCPEDYVLIKLGIYDPGIPAIMDVMHERLDFMLDLTNYKEYLRKSKEVSK